MTVVLVLPLVVMPLYAHADWENGMAVAWSRTVEKWNYRLLWVSCINLGLAFLNVFMLQRRLTILNWVLLVVQFFHVLIGFDRSEQSGTIALLLFVLTVGHLILGRKFAKER